KVIAPTEPKPDDLWDIPISLSLRAAKDLRDLLPMDEHSYIFGHGPAFSDGRAYVLYTALDEAKKTALYLMRIREFFDAPIDPRKDRLSRLVFAQVIEEQQARERRLLEVLVTLILF